MGYTVEKLNLKDLVLILELTKSVVVNSTSKFISDKALEFTNNGDSDKYIKKNANNIYVLKYNSIIIGVAIINNNTIESLYIDDKYQNIGAGSTFLFHLLIMLFGNFSKVKAKCFNKNDIANSFYLRNGFIFNECVRNQYFNEDLSSFSMVNPNIV